VQRTSEECEPWLSNRITCCAYACPQVLDLNSARSAGKLGITSLVVSSDIVPRLSLYTGEKLAADVGRIAAERRDWKVSQFVPSIAKTLPAAKIWQQEKATALFPPGEVLFINAKSDQIEGVMGMVVDQEVFGSIRVSRTMFSAHMQNNYFRALGVADGDELSSCGSKSFLVLKSRGSLFSCLQKPAVSDPNGCIKEEAAGR